MFFAWSSYIYLVRLSDQCSKRLGHSAPNQWPVAVGFQNPRPDAVTTLKAPRPIRPSHIVPSLLFCSCPKQSQTRPDARERSVHLQPATSLCSLLIHNVSGHGEAGHGQAAELKETTAATRRSLSRPSSPAESVESNFGPGFWDGLSKVWLEHCALRELDRRNKPQALSRHTSMPAEEDYAADLARFARHDGPDLQHLRGYVWPVMYPPFNDWLPNSHSSTHNLRATVNTLRSVGK